MKRRLKGNAAQVERAFAKALSWEVVKGSNMTHRSAVAALRRMERTYLNLLSSRDRYLARELRRRTAEQILMHAILRGSSFSVCRARLNALSKLGFTDIETKAHCHLPFARGAFARGHKQVAYRYATAMASELHGSLRRRRSLSGRELLDLLRTLWYEIEPDEFETRFSMSRSPDDPITR